MSRTSLTADGLPVGSLEYVIFRFAQDHSLIHQPGKRLGRADMPEIKQHLVPESRIEQMQDGMLDAADVEIDRHPVPFFYRIDQVRLVVRIDISQVIPARPGPLRHGVGLARIAFSRRSST